MWEQAEYEFRHDDTFTRVKMELDENTYLILLMRYRELFEKGDGGNDPTEFDYPVDTYITETGTGTIDAEYINSKFVRFIKKLYTDGPGSEPTKEALRELHKTFASLPQKDQRTAILILHDIQCGDLRPEAGKTIQDYINEYQLKELHKQALLFAEGTGVNLRLLEDLIKANPTEENLDDFSRFSELRNTLDNVKTKAFIAKVEGEEPKPRMVIAKGAKLLKEFVLDAEMRKKILAAYLNEEVTWSNVIHGIEPLWQLKYSQEEGKQELYQWLLIVKEWRNSESHISPTASEKEINAAISIILTMYCYATGACITELECNGHEID